MILFPANGVLCALLAVTLQQGIHVDVSLVTVGVRVEDSRGRDVRGLKPEDFTLTEDGKPQRIASFSSEPQPITLGIVFDRSSSMESNRKIDRAKDAAQALIQGAREGSEFFFIDFNEKVRVAADLGSERSTLMSAIQKTEPEGSTSLYDAILEGLTVTGRANLPRQALVVISDGADQHSTHELQEVIDIVRESAIQIYTIGYFSKEEEQMFRTSGDKLSLINGAEVDNPRHALQKIAEESGAMSFFPRSDEELSKAVVQINQDLLTQYSLGFYPESASAERTYRRLSVTVVGNRYQVRSRPGYGVRQFAPGNTPPKAEVSRAYEARVEIKDGRLVYREDFKDSSSGWPERETAGYTRDGYRLSGEDVMVSGGPELRNFNASVTFSVEEQLPSSNPLPRVGERNLPTTGLPALPVGGGLVFRQTERSYYAFVVYPQNGLRPGFAVAVYAENNKEPAELARWPLLSRPSRDHTIQVRCQEHTCELHEGGSLLGRLNNVADEEGRIGLALGAEGKALFNDLTVEEIGDRPR